MKSLVRDVSTKSLFSDRNTRNPFIIELHLHLQHKKSICSNLQNKKNQKSTRSISSLKSILLMGSTRDLARSKCEFLRPRFTFEFIGALVVLKSLTCIHIYNGEMKDHGWSAHQMLKKRKSKSIYKFEIEQKLLLNGTRERKWRACKKVKKGF